MEAEKRKALSMYLRDNTRPRRRQGRTYPLASILNVSSDLHRSVSFSSSYQSVMLTRSIQNPAPTEAPAKSLIPNPTVMLSMTESVDTACRAALVWCRLTASPIQGG